MVTVAVISDGDWGLLATPAPATKMDNVFSAFHVASCTNTPAIAAPFPPPIIESCIKQSPTTALLNGSSSR